MHARPHRRPCDELLRVLRPPEGANLGWVSIFLIFLCVFLSSFSITHTFLLSFTCILIPFSVFTNGVLHANLIVCSRSACWYPRSLARRPRHPAALELYVARLMGRTYGYLSVSSWHNIPVSISLPFLHLPLPPVPSLPAPHHACASAYQYHIPTLPTDATPKLARR